MPAEEHVIERAGCPLHYWISGKADAPLIVLTHGATLDHRMFEAQLPALEPNYRVLTWDIRGHGLSRPIGQAFTVPGAVADLLAILDQVGASSAIFAGQSTGGYVVQELVFRHQERVKALVMIDCTCITLPISLVESLMLRSTPALLRLYPADMLNRQTANSSSIKPDVQKYIYEAASRIPKADTMAIWKGIANCLHAEPNYHIDQPLLLVHGDHDRLGNIAKIAPIWAQREPHCRYAVIPNAGHCSNQDNPEFFNHLLLDFLRSSVSS